MKSTAKNRTLRALQLAGEQGCTTALLCQPAVGGERFGGRICELRAEGHEIETEILRPGSARYVLRSSGVGADSEGGRSRDPRPGPLSVDSSGSGSIATTGPLSSRVPGDRRWRNRKRYCVVYDATTGPLRVYRRRLDFDVEALPLVDDAAELQEAA